MQPGSRSRKRVNAGLTVYVPQQVVQPLRVIARDPPPVICDHRGQGCAQREELGERLRVVHDVARYVWYASFGEKLSHHSTRASVIVRVEQHPRIGVIAHVSRSWGLRRSPSGSNRSPSTTLLAASGSCAHGPRSFGSQSRRSWSAFSIVTWVVNRVCTCQMYSIAESRFTCDHQLNHV